MCLRINSAMNWQRAVDHFIYIVAPHDTLPVDGQVYDQLRILLLVSHECKYAEWQPLILGRCGGRGAFLGEIIGLLAELFGRSDRLAVDRHLIVYAGDVASIIIRDGRDVFVVVKHYCDRTPSRLC